MNEIIWSTGILYRRKVETLLQVASKDTRLCVTSESVIKYSVIRMQFDNEDSYNPIEADLPNFETRAFDIFHRSLLISVISLRNKSRFQVDMYI